MTTSENQDSLLSASDERTVTCAKESLTTLLRKDDCSPEEISAALEYLTELKNRIIDVGERQPALLSDHETYSRAWKAETSRQQRMDQDIIDAKLKVSELLSERDSIARDLARAKRALKETDGPSNTPMSGSTIDKKEARRRAYHENGEIDSEDETDERGDLQEQENIDTLQKSLTDDMERLRLTQEELIDVVDEINSTRKKRAELQEKVKLAQEEW